MELAAAKDAECNATLLFKLCVTQDARNTLRMMKDELFLHKRQLPVVYRGSIEEKSVVPYI